MTPMPQDSDSEPIRPRPYGRQPARQRPGTHLMVCLRLDAYEAVQVAMAAHGLSKSGAIHHLVRLGAGLKPLIP